MATRRLAPSKSRPEKTSFTLVAIGVFKLVKSTLLLALGIALVHWRHQDLSKVASFWIDTLVMSRPYIDSIISKLD